MSTFPNITPPSQFSEKTVASRLQKKSSSGHTRLRAKGASPKKEFTLEWDAMMSADKAALDAFFEVNHSLDFDYTHFETSVSYKVFFENDDLEFRYFTEGYWKVKVVLGET